MQGIYRDSSKIKPMKDKIKLICKLLLAALLCSGFASVGAQELTHERFKFSQSVFIDSSQKMTFEEVLNAPFSPFAQKDKLPFYNNSVWIELRFTNTPASTQDLYLRILPVLLTQLTLYLPNEKEASHWTAKTFEANELNAPIELGTLEPNGRVFLHVSSAIDLRINMTIDDKESMIDIQRRIDMFFSMMLTLMLIIALLSVYHLFSHFNWISVGALFLSVSVSLSWICLMGFLPNVFGVDQNKSQEIIPIFLCTNIFIFISFWFSIAYQLF